MQGGEIKRFPPRRVCNTEFKAPPCVKNKLKQRDKQVQIVFSLLTLVT